MHLSHSLFAGAALAAAAIAAPAQASVCVNCAYYLSYDVTTSYDVSNIASFYTVYNGGGIVNSHFAPTGTSTIYDGFPKYDPVLSTFLLGVAYDLPGDPQGQKHLVVFANLDWASDAENIAFGTLFPNTLEANIIQALENIGGASTDSDVLNASYDALSQFDNGDIRNGPNGPVAFAPGDAFALVAFSDGQIIGRGTAIQAAVPTVPEPASWAMMIAGFGLLGGTLRAARAKTSIRFA